MEIREPAFESMVKRAKRRSLWKTILISFIVTLVMLYGILAGGTWLMERKLEDTIERISLLSFVQGAGVEMTNTTITGFIGARLIQANYIKVIDDEPIVWNKENHLLTIFGNVSSWAENQLYLLNGRNYLNNLRMVNFYSPTQSVDGPNRNIFEDVPSDSKVELALSFKEPLSIKDVERYFRDHLAWVWVDAFEDNVSGDLAYGYTYSKETGADAAKSFQTTIDQLAQQEEYYKAISDYFNNHDQNISGVLITGTAQELQKYIDLPIVRAADLGVTIPEAR